MLSCFNPHPTRRLGATPDCAHNILPIAVSILTQPEGWVLPSSQAPPTSTLWFQSSPNPKVGCYLSLLYQWGIVAGFNPHPTRRLGATRKPGCKLVRWPCSFNPHPTRRLGATNLKVLEKYPVRRFNPHPTRRLGATTAQARSASL